MEEQEKGTVATCNASECTHNQNMTCQASTITVSRHEDHADCETYTPQQ